MRQLRRVPVLLATAPVLGSCRRLGNAHEARGNRMEASSVLRLLTRFASLFAVATLFTIPSDVLARQTGTVTGVVREASSGLPLTGAQVVIESTVYGGLTNTDGRFLLLNIPAGTYRLRVELIGLGTEVNEVVVEAGPTTTSDFRLSPSALALDEVVVTVTGERRKRELGNAVGTIQADQVVEVAPVHDMSDLLRGRTAGVQIFSGSGATGMGGRVRVRGASSISLSNEPLLYVDGVRVESRGGMTVWAGGQRPSRLDDINPEDIESVEIVKGPAAATLYGTEAANGVIRITTKQGRPGETRWNLWTETGLVQDRATYPSNYAGLDARQPEPK